VSARLVKVPILLLVSVWLACGGGSPANVSPTASFSRSPEGVVITGVTIVVFTATASDPDGDVLTLTWDFGDGVSGSGASVTHVYSSEGVFPVSLSIRDGRGGAAALGSTVTTRSLSGRWLLSEGGARFYERGYDIVQAGPALGGQPFAVPDKGCLGALTGVATSPRELSFHFAGCDNEIVVISGIADQGLLSVAGTYTHPSGPPQPIVLAHE